MIKTFVKNVTSHVLVVELLQRIVMDVKKDLFSTIMNVFGHQQMYVNNSLEHQQINVQFVLMDIIEMKHRVKNVLIITHSMKKML